MNNSEIKNILKTSKTIAVIVCSSNPEKAAHRISKYMQEDCLDVVK